MTWDIILKTEFEKDYYKNLEIALSKYSDIIPKKDDIFNCFKYFEYIDTKVVIIGQDPYPNVDHCHGLSFSVKNKYITKSIFNIFKELESDLNIKRSNSNLEDWAYQGILLLNTILTVRDKKPLSCKNMGWEIFSLEIIKNLNKLNHIVFILWGNNAIKYEKYLDNKNNLIIKSSHPSPLGAYRTFFGSKPFSRCNNFLIQNNKSPIRW